MWRVKETRDGGLELKCFSALTLGFFDVAMSLSEAYRVSCCFSALTLGFFDVA